MNIINKYFEPVTINSSHNPINFYLTDNYCCLECTKQTKIYSYVKKEVF